jgi:hypothetical protein
MSAFNSPSLIFPSNYCTLHPGSSKGTSCFRWCICSLQYLTLTDRPYDQTLQTRLRIASRARTACMLVVPSTEPLAQHPDMTGFEVGPSTTTKMVSFLGYPSLFNRVTTKEFRHQQTSAGSKSCRAQAARCPGGKGEATCAPSVTLSSTCFGTAASNRWVPREY